MSIETIRVVRCDRCGREIPVGGEFEEMDEKEMGDVHFVLADKVVRFNEVCEKCEKRIAALMEMVKGGSAKKK